MTQNLETAVALRRINNSGSSDQSLKTPTTYADLDVLSRAIGLRKMLGVLANCTVGVTAVVAAAYAVSVAAMISTVCLLDRHTPLGPRAVSASLDYLGARLAGQQGGKADPTAVSVVTLDSEVAAGDLQASLASPSPQVKFHPFMRSTQGWIWKYLPKEVHGGAIMILHDLALGAG